MKDWYEENVSFKVRVLEVQPDGKAERCRAGHEPGDTYEFQYRTPEGLCGEAFHKLWPVLHSLQVKGDFRKYGSDQPNAVRVWCPSCVVGFEVEATYKE
jgi:uncharacterized repeat protein (TIGR04076 family)